MSNSLTMKIIWTIELWHVYNMLPMINQSFIIQLFIYSSVNQLFHYWMQIYGDIKVCYVCIKDRPWVHVPFMLNCDVLMRASWCRRIVKPVWLSRFEESHFSLSSVVSHAWCTSIVLVHKSIREDIQVCSETMTTQGWYHRQWMQKILFKLFNL